LLGNHEDNDLTGGLSFAHEQGLVERNGFCLLPLHGLICYPIDSMVEGSNYTYLSPAEFLAPASPHRLERIAQTVQDIPPMIFPWEFMDDDGNLRQECSRWDHDVAHRKPCRKLSSYFLDIWSRAQKLVQSAEKISFVGIAMHSYLQGGLKYLFRGRAGVADILSVNPANVGRDGDLGPEFVPTTPAFRLRNFLRQTCPNLTSRRTPGLRVVHLDGGTTVRTMTDFRTFIEKEL
jgi:hypothetical protein